MRGLVILLIVLFVIASFSFVAASMSNSNNEKIKNNDQNKIIEFSTFTSAVCESKEEAVHCKDEVFVNCNGSISKVIDVAECEGLKINVPKATGTAVFGNDWKDPRR